jgi:hypothetical protein
MDGPMRMNGSVVDEFQKSGWATGSMMRIEGEFALAVMRLVRISRG